MDRFHTPRRRLFAVTVEMAYGADIGRPVACHQGRQSPKECQRSQQGDPISG